MLLEFCAENFDRVPEAIEKGIHRIELCDRLDVGGTTPHSEVQRETVNYAHMRGVQVVSMIRPRGGDFVYSDEEKETMIKQAHEAVDNGVDGLVFGCLTEEGQLDQSILNELIAIAQKANREVVFHMAFDHIPEESQKEVLEWLVDKGVTRILTRGGKEGSALDNSESINRTIRWANDRIQILPGGGVTHDNLPELSRTLNTNQFHGTKVVPL
ncbi:copper homeostasis protein CutC [Alkalibacterium iburiense]|uniref:PF03932 family protein CutC n=1 Tax=Alkalibacterium iburiense TaxID=290589 RepID=A0ABN0X906_9LACT